MRKKRSTKRTAYFFNMDCKNVSSKFNKKLKKQRERKNNRLQIFRGVTILFCLLLTSYVIPKINTNTSAQATISTSGSPIIESEDPSLHLTSTPIVSPKPTQPVTATIGESVVLATIPQCSTSFTDVRWGTGIVTPPQWFRDWFVKYNVTNCLQVQWMSQIAFYETRWCHGDQSLCSSIIGYSQDTSLFQYIPSTWAGDWNPYRDQDIHNPEAQFQATILKYSLGGQNAWSTNQFTRL